MKKSIVLSAGSAVAASALMALFGTGAAAADDFAGIEPQSYDTLILNGVAQHFPSIEYFLRVI